MPADIIILAAIAIFVLLRLRSVLGHKIGHDQPPRDSMPDEGDRVVQVPPRQTPAVIEGEARRVEPTPEAQAALAQLPDEVRQGMDAVIKADPAFSLPDFLKGARMAFDMVVEAYSRDDRETLKMLLSKEIFENFRKELEQAKKEGQRVETTLVAILSAKPVAVEMKKNTAQITVAFESEQIQVVRDADNKIVEGDPSDIAQVDDEWVFERDLRSSNPNWKIIAT